MLIIGYCMFAVIRSQQMQRKQLVWQSPLKIALAYVVDLKCRSVAIHFSLQNRHIWNATHALKSAFQQNQVPIKCRSLSRWECKICMVQ